MDREGIALDSTDIWTKGPMQRYKERPADLEAVCLADFLAWYTPANVKRRRGPEEDYNSEDEEPETNSNTKHRKRDVPSVLRTRAYDLSDVMNYKRELALLYVHSGTRWLKSPIETGSWRRLMRKRFTSYASVKNMRRISRYSNWCKNYEIYEITKKKTTILA